MKRIIIAVLLLVPVVIAQEAPNRQLSQDDYVYQPKAHHVIYAVWTQDKNGAQVLHGFRVRDVQESGDWTEKSVSIEDQVVGSKVIPAGTFHFFDPAKTDHPNIMKGPMWYKSAAWYRSRRDFLREETIAGVHCFTTSAYNGAGEMSMSPEYGATPLRTKFEGSTIEALKVY